MWQIGQDKFLVLELAWRIDCSLNLLINCWMSGWLRCMFCLRAISAVGMFWEVIWAVEIVMMEEKVENVVRFWKQIKNL